MGAILIEYLLATFSLQFFSVHSLLFSFFCLFRSYYLRISAESLDYNYSDCSPFQSKQLCVAHILVHLFCSVFCNDPFPLESYVAGSQISTSRTHRHSKNHTSPHFDKIVSFFLSASQRKCQVIAAQPGRNCGCGPRGHHEGEQATSAAGPLYGGQDHVHVQKVAGRADDEWPRSHNRHQSLPG